MCYCIQWVSVWNVCVEIVEGWELGWWRLLVTCNPFGKAGEQPEGFLICESGERRESRRDVRKRKGYRDEQRDWWVQEWAVYVQVSICWEVPGLYGACEQILFHHLWWMVAIRSSSYSYNLKWVPVLSHTYRKLKEITLDIRAYV